MKGTLDYDCENEDCDYELLIIVDYTPYIPAQICGPPENCYPEEGGEFEIVEPECCPKCGTKITEEKVRDRFFEKLSEKERDGWDRYWDSLND